MRLFRAQDGAAAVEMALLLPLLVVLAFGIIEFGTAYNRSQGMAAAVREGARLAASSSSTDPQTLETVTQTVHAALQSDAAGAGFPAAGGTLAGDIMVRVHNLDSPEAGGTQVNAGGTACAAGVHSVKVETEVVEGRRAAYGVELIFWEAAPLSLHSEAIFRCLNS